RAPGADGPGAAQAGRRNRGGREGDDRSFMIKLSNRRKKRPEYLLDVKVQTRGRTLARLRAVVTVFVILGMLVLTGYGLFRLVRFTTDRLVYNNPRFAIHQIVVD